MAESEHEWISRRAYALWEEEGYPTGKDNEHWERARQEYLLFAPLGVTKGLPKGNGAATEKAAATKPEAVAKVAKPKTAKPAKTPAVKSPAAKSAPEKSAAKPAKAKAIAAEAKPAAKTRSKKLVAE